MNSVFRNLSVLGALATLAASSQAVVLDFHYAGTFTALVGSTTVTGSTITDTGSTSTSPVASLAYTFSTVTAATSGSGVVTFADASKVYFDFAGSQNPSTLSGVVVSFYADALHTSLIGGGGSVGGTFNTTGQPVEGEFYGEYTPVPEPASMAAMAVGAVGLLARRKRGAR